MQACPKFIRFSFISLLLTFVGFALIGLAWEAALTFKYRKNKQAECVYLPNYRSPYLYLYAPHSTVTVAGIPMKFNNFSLRRAEDIHPESKKEIFRVLSFGDSVAMGYGVHDDQHYAHLLEKKTSFEVFNVVGGSSPSIQSFHVKRGIDVFKPHFIVMELELLNDLSDEAFIQYSGIGDDGLPLGIRSGRYLLSWDMKQLSVVPIAIPWLERTKVYADFIRRLGNFLSLQFPNPLFSKNSSSYFYNLGFDQFFIKKERINNALNQAFNIYEGLHRLAQSQGIGFLLILIPSKYALYENLYRLGATAIMEQAELAAKTRRIPFLSLMKEMSEYGGETLFMDFCHPNAQGHQIIAKTLHRYFESYLQNR